MAEFCVACILMESGINRGNCFIPSDPVPGEGIKSSIGSLVLGQCFGDVNDWANAKRYVNFSELDGLVVEVFGNFTRSEW